MKESRLTEGDEGPLREEQPAADAFPAGSRRSWWTAKSQDGAKVGDKVLVDMFEGDKFVDVVATSKGRGFAGVVKRHKFAGGAASHGSMFQITGSIGSSAFPSRVFKGMRMSGHMGVNRVTTRNLRVLGVDQGREPAGRRRCGAGAERRLRGD